MSEPTIAEQVLAAETETFAEIGAGIADRLRRMADEIEARTGDLPTAYYGTTRTVGLDFAGVAQEVQESISWGLANAKVSRLTSQAAKAQDALIAVHLEKQAQADARPGL